MRWFGKIGFAVAMLGTSVAMAGRPLTIDDAGVRQKGEFQFSSGVAYASGSEITSWNTPLSLGYGITDSLELDIGCGWLWQYGIDDQGHRTWEDGLADLPVGAKWHFADQERLLLDQAVALTVKIPTADDNKGLGSGKMDEDITWIGTRKLGENWSVDVNVGFTLVGVPDGADLSNLVHYGVATEYQLTRTLQPVLEIYAVTPTGGKDVTSAFINGGVRWALTEKLTLDAAIGTTIAGEGPDVFVTAGFSWIF